MFILHRVDLWSCFFIYFLTLPYLWNDKILSHTIYYLMANYQFMFFHKKNIFIILLTLFPYSSKNNLKHQGVQIFFYQSYICKILTLFYVLFLPLKRSRVNVKSILICILNNALSVSGLSLVWVNNYFVEVIWGCV